MSCARPGSTRPTKAPDRPVGNTLIVVGVGLIVLGVLVKLGLLSWFGNLPGDIRIENERSTIFAPITSMIVLSVVGSVLFSLISRWFGE